MSEETATGTPTLDSSSETIELRLGQETEMEPTSDETSTDEQLTLRLVDERIKQATDPILRRFEELCAFLTSRTEMKSTSNSKASSSRRNHKCFSPSRNRYGNSPSGIFRDYRSVSHDACSTFPLSWVNVFKKSKTLHFDTNTDVDKKKQISICRLTQPLLYIIRFVLYFHLILLRLELKMIFCRNAHESPSLLTWVQGEILFSSFSLIIANPVFCMILFFTPKHFESFLFVNCRLLQWF